MENLVKITKVLFWVAFILGGIILSTFLDKNVFHIFIEKESMRYYALLIPGVFLFIVILSVVKNMRRYLSKHTPTEGLEKVDLQEMITHGPYEHMRHPMHFGLMLLPLAIALISTSFSFLLIIAPIQILLVFIYIKIIEEPKQKRKFGEVYLTYMKKVPMFCLKRACIESLLKTVSL